MAYKAIRTAAFVPASGIGELRNDLYTLTFPEEWRQSVLDLYAGLRPEKARGRILEYGSVPIRRLNQLLRAVAPGLVSVGPKAPANTDSPWLYSETPFDTEAMRRYVNVWLDDLAPREKGTDRAVAEAYRPTLDALQRMDPAQLTWERTTVDLLSAEVSDGGTCVPDRILYRLLPEYAASRVAAAEPYEFGGRRVHWHRSAGSSEYAELVSDVLSYTPRGREHTGKPWYYSGYLRFYLRTEEFSPVPRLYVQSGIHRWVSGKAKFQGSRDVSAYLLADDTLLPGASTPGRYAVADLYRDPRTEKTQWRLGGTMGMLRKLAVTDTFPDPEVLAKDATSSLEEGQGPRIALTHHTTMGSHKVGTGLMPEERRRLTEWVSDILAPDLVLAPDLRKIAVPRRAVARESVLEKKTQGNEEKRALALRNAERRRAEVAEALQGEHLSALVLYQNEDMRDRLIGAAERSLNLAGHRREQGPERWTWQTPDLAVHLVAREAGRLTSRLGGDDRPKRGEEFERAAAERRSLVREAVQETIAASGVNATLALVELDGGKSSTGRKRFTPTRDPKGAIRTGCAEAGLVSQFVRPIDLEREEESKKRGGKKFDAEEDAQHRAEAAWSDGLRQLGTTLVPRVASGGALPDDLAQIAFWMVRRNVASGSTFSQFTPVALLSRGEGPVLGRTPDHEGWVPYPQLLRDLTGRIKEEDERTAWQQTALVASFVRTTLYQFRRADTLVMAHAQNARNRWPWLGNGRIVLDRVALGNGEAKGLSTLGRRLRFVRVTSAERAETPQWWAPVEEGAAGFAKGLWRSDTDPTGRVFHSVGEKPGTAKTHKEVTKLTPHTIDHEDKGGEPAERDMHVPTAEARTPQILRLALAGLLPDDDPAAWAMFLHMQRDGEDYREDLALPALLHLAAKTNEYALPYEANEADEEEGEGGEGKGPEQMTLFDLA
ncbi:pPIWI_RE module domain-containing protein [Nocardiopsis halotolerans]|uniref:pPIWI_RE module domain-containing protein n=1 Tax=Nocardiopsis halotolerans TaxID=124252 RepID=UPI00034BAD82|nr:DUF3962 domain-containing protein [Nocardiopsis halotolerans]